MGYVPLIFFAADWAKNAILTHYAQELSDLKVPVLGSKGDANHIVHLQIHPR